MQRSLSSLFILALLLTTPVSAEEPEAEPSDISQSSSEASLAEDLPSESVTDESDIFTEESPDTPSESDPTEDESPDETQTDEDTRDTEPPPDPTPVAEPPPPQDPLAFLKGLQGNYETDLFTGAATYQYPLWVPQGRNGMTPSLSLSYSSSDRNMNSNVGYGWNLSTGGAIYRSTARGIGQLYSQNDFSVSLFGSGYELVSIDATNGKYGAKVESGFADITLQNNSWIMKDTQGTTYTFGSDSSTRHTDPSDSTRVYKWMLERVEDTDGNSMSFTYHQADGQVYPDTIVYSGHGSNNGIYEIRFLRSARNAFPTSYTTGFRIESREFIDRVELFSLHSGSPELIRQYDLEYTQESTVLQQLESITTSNGSNILLPIQFDYYDGSENIAGQKVHLLRHITYPTGGTQEILYKPSTAYRTAAQGSIANPNLPFIIHTVHQTTTSPLDGTAQESATTTYEYSGGHYYFDQLDAYKKEYSGFHEVKIIDPAGNGRKLYFHQSEFAVDNDTSAPMGEYQDHISKKGRIFREELRDDQDNVYQLSIRKWEKTILPTDNTHDWERNHVFLSQEITRHFDGNSDARSTAMSYQYDQYGNITQTIDHGEVDITDDQGNFTDILDDAITTDIEYAQNESVHILSLPSRQESRDHSGNIIAESKTYYDDLPLGQVTTGNVTKTETCTDAIYCVSGPSQTGYITTFIEYDNPYGLPTKITNPRGYETTITYDDYNLFPESITNALGHTTTSTYNYLYGIAKTTTDPNGAVTRTILDPLGRVAETRITDPENISQEITISRTTYDTTSIPNSITQTAVFDHQTSPTQDGEIQVITYFDGFGRAIQTKTEAEGVEQYTKSSIIYDKRGNVHKQTLPIFITGNAFAPINANSEIGTQYEYDPVNRVVRVETPIGTTTTTYDQWAQTIIDANGNQKDLVSDARGNLVEVREYLDSTSYSTFYDYDALNNLIQITDAKGNERNLTYDLLGRKLSEEDLHTPNDTTFGTWTFVYDENGNLTSSTDPKQQFIEYTYDALDRLETESTRTLPASDAALQTTYTYDQGTYGIGRLSAVDAENVGKNYTYDVLGRILTETKDITAGTGAHIGAPLHTSFEYNIGGNTQTLTYPSGMIVSYGYNNAGGLETVQKDGEDIVTNMDTSPIGLIEEIEYANGVTTTNTYDIDQMYRLTNKTTVVGTTLELSLQDLSYTFDPVGNITQIIDASNTNTAKTADYTYDNLDRLTTATITNTANGEDYTRTFDYDILGNILNKSDQGDYTYSGGDEATSSATTSNPHAVTDIAGVTYTYDDNGNLTSNNTWTHAWDYKDRLESSTDGITTVAYTYDEGGNRITKTNTATGKTTVYVNEFVDIEDGQVKNHIFAGAMKVATLSDGEGEPSGSTCTPPGTGDWIITEDCTASESIVAHGNIIIQSNGSDPNVVLTIEGSAIVEMDLAEYSLEVKAGNGVLIQEGGTLRQTTGTIDPGSSGETGSFSGLVYHHSDHLSGGSVDTDENGEVLQLLDYYPFGETRIDESSGEYQNDYKFTGKEKDEDTGLYYYEARYYDSGIGRFISIDPWFGDISDPQSLNKYAYVRNNPLKYVDPTGKITEIWIRHDNTGELRDFGHVMIRVYHADYDQIFGFFEKEGVATLSKNTVKGQMEVYNRIDEGSTFSVFKLNINFKEEFLIKDALESFYTNQSTLPGYSAFANNCADFIVDELLNKFTEFDLKDFAGFTPEDLAGQLFSHEKVGNIYGGYEEDGMFNEVEKEEKDSTLSKFRKTLKKARDKVYEKRKEEENKEKDDSAK